MKQLHYFISIVVEIKFFTSITIIYIVIFSLDQGGVVYLVRLCPHNHPPQTPYVNYGLINNNNNK